MVLFLHNNLAASKLTIKFSVRKSGPADISASRCDAVGNTRHLDGIRAKNGSAESNEASSPDFALKEHTGGKGTS